MPMVCGEKKLYAASSALASPGHPFLLTKKVSSCRSGIISNQKILCLKLKKLWACNQGKIMDTMVKHTFIDSHCHLEMKDFDKDRADVIERAHTAGVAWMINIGIDLESTQKGIALTEMFDTVYTTAGVHPHE